MMSPEPVTLEVAGARDAPLLTNLLELYIHDMSEIFPIELGPDGRFGYDRLPLYWSEPERRFPFLIRSGSRVVGFALVTLGLPASEDPAAHDVAEFFVLRRYRRSAVGQRAAVQLWNRFPGPWTVRVSEGNARGVPFWTEVISDYTSDAATVQTLPGGPHAWRVFSFHAKEGGA